MGWYVSGLAGSYSAPRGWREVVHSVAGGSGAGACRIRGSDLLSTMMLSEFLCLSQPWFSHLSNGPTSLTSWEGLEVKCLGQCLAHSRCLLKVVNVLFPHPSLGSEMPKEREVPQDKQTWGPEGLLGEDSSHTLPSQKTRAAPEGSSSPFLLLDRCPSPSGPKSSKCSHCSSCKT